VKPDESFRSSRSAAKMEKIPSGKEREMEKEFRLIEFTGAE
jgi:hypothetical protein